MIKSMIFHTWDPNTSLSFLTSIMRMSTEMKMNKAMYSMNKTYQDLGLRLGLRMDFLLCPILRPNILGHILFK